MNRKFILLLILLFAACINNNKQSNPNIAPASIYKVWQFKTTAGSANHKKPVWIGNNLLDLTNKDTLRFSYGGSHNKPTAYPYKIGRDTIFINNKPAYKILKMTGTELNLMVAFNKVNQKRSAPKDSIIMIYHSK